jgi:hypothetical protein
MDGDCTLPTVHVEQEVILQPLEWKPFICNEQDSVLQFTVS